ncbi:hypothetical protein ACFY7H_01345 [Streptomyces sp. NPDC012794]|uniref:hypothetical protein n=1 Tax=Streptomyces sp. NPDC012794 TaxID=3364850 RepID=UPI0036B0406C
MTTTAPPEPAVLRRRPGLRPLRLVAQGPLCTASAAVLAALALMAVLAPVLAPYDPEVLDLSASLAGTTGEHLLGTDQSPMRAPSASPSKPPEAPPGPPPPPCS